MHMIYLTLFKRVKLHNSKWKMVGQKNWWLVCEVLYHCCGVITIVAVVIIVFLMHPAPRALCHLVFMLWIHNCMKSEQNLSKDHHLWGCSWMRINVIYYDVYHMLTLSKTYYNVISLVFRSFFRSLVHSFTGWHSLNLSHIIKLSVLSLLFTGTP